MRWGVRLLLLGATACGSSAPPPHASGVAQHETAAAQADRAERERRATLAAAHRGLEDEQATALAATCEQPAGSPATPRCLPSCYHAEPPDPRAGQRLAGAVEIPHLVCTRTAGAPYLVIDELLGPQVTVRPHRGRLPRPHRAGTWQAAVATAVGIALQPELARGDVLQVRGAWQARVHPLTSERLRCVQVTHVARSRRRPFDACGGGGPIACEAGGSAAAHGINVVRYRLAEAQRLLAAGQAPACQQAATEAIAVAHGMPRWRQYMTLNTTAWKSAPRYRTRFDGLLDEDTLFTTAMRLGAEAAAVHAACGGGAAPRTTVQQEQSFHTCW